MKNLFLLCCALSIAFASCKKDKKPTPDPIPECTLIGYVDSFDNGRTYPYIITYENDKITKIEGHGLLREFAYNGNNIHIKTFISQTVTGEYFYSEDSLLLNSNGMIDVKYMRRRIWDPGTGTYPLDSFYTRLAYSYTGDQLQKIEMYYYDKNLGMEHPASVSEFVWENGNCIKWLYTSDGTTSTYGTYTYDNTKKAHNLDYLNAQQMMELGALYIKNKNLVSAAYEMPYNMQFTYTFDQDNKITILHNKRSLSNGKEDYSTSRQYQYKCK